METKEKDGTDIEKGKLLSQATTTNNEKSANNFTETCISSIKQKMSKWKTPAKYFLLNFICSLIPTCLDMGSDAFLSWTFFNGTEYGKNVPNESYHSVESCGDPLSRTIIEGKNGSQWIPMETNYHFMCFEKDPIYGAVTLALIFLPGIMWGQFYYRHLCTQLNLKSGKESVPQRYFKLMLILILTIFCCLSFPLQIVGIKLVGLFTNSKNIKEFITEISSREGLFESSLQVCFQLYIIFSKEDRQPSQLQVVTPVSYTHLTLPTNREV